MYFAFKRTSCQLKSKDFRWAMTRATQKEQAATTLKSNLLNIFRKFYQRNLRLSFLDYEPNLWDNIHLHFFQVQLDWSCRNLSLSTEHLFWIRFHWCAKWLSLVCTWPSLCISILVFFLILKLVVFNKLNENVFITLMKSEEVKKIGNCCCLVLFFIKFIELRCTQMY